MNNIVSVTIALLIIVAQTNNVCDPPLTIIPSVFLNNLFDNGFKLTRSGTALDEIVSNPNLDTFKNYAISFAPSILTIVAFGGLSIILFIVCIFQLMCFNCCRIE